MGESCEIPLRYYENNVTGTLNLLESMKKHGVQAARLLLVGDGLRRPRLGADPRGLPALRDQPLRRTKLMIEEICRDLAQGGSRVEDDPAALLQPGRRARERAHRRGSRRHPQQPRALHHAGRGGAARAARRLRRRLSDTRTAPACATTSTSSISFSAISPRSTRSTAPSGCVAYNLGTGTGYSVLEMVEAARTGDRTREIPVEIVARRPGRHRHLLRRSGHRPPRRCGWRAERAAWTRWWRTPGAGRSANPNGFNGSA